MVEKGTTPSQRPILATLSTLPETAKAEKVKSPAIIIVGKVCAYSNQFDWFDHLPLKGKTVVVTRPKERAGTLSERLRALGANVEDSPALRPTPSSLARKWKKQWTTSGAMSG